MFYFDQQRIKKNLYNKHGFEWVEKCMIENVRDN